MSSLRCRYRDPYLRRPPLGVGALVHRVGSADRGRVLRVAACPDRPSPGHQSGPQGALIRRVIEPSAQPTPKLIAKLVQISQVPEWLGVRVRHRHTQGLGLMPMPAGQALQTRQQARISAIRRRSGTWNPQLHIRMSIRRPYRGYPRQSSDVKRSLTGPTALSCQSCLPLAAACALSTEQVHSMPSASMREGLELSTSRDYCDSWSSDAYRDAWGDHDYW